MRKSRVTDSSERALYSFLEKKFREYNREEFIADDPVSIPHEFSVKEDIEIAGFLTASISWGQRPVIVRNSRRLISLMSNSPYEFIMNAGASDYKKLSAFVHRTFNGTDTVTFAKALKRIYADKGGLENVFTSQLHQAGNMMDAISGFRKEFLSIRHDPRTDKHISDPARGSAAKRINMFLRWMVRKDSQHVDFGLWNKIPSAVLMIPLDVHVGNTARELGLLTRRQDDRKAVEELTERLRGFDPIDPVKYDFALFGTGISLRN